MSPKERLLDLIEIADLTRTEIARAAGCSIAFVSQQAGGHRGVTPAVLAAAERLARQKAGRLLVTLAARIATGDSCVGAEHALACPLLGGDG